MDKLLIICGPTATGKTKLGLELAKEFNGEILSVDSRQVYKGMDIITGKDIDKYEFRIEVVGSGIKERKREKGGEKFDYGVYVIDNVPVWGLDIVSPDYTFNVSDYVDYAGLVLDDINKRGKLPIIVGGTGQYIKELLNPSETLHISPNEKLRKKLERYSLEQLQKKIQEIDSGKWEKMNDSDRKNPRRLARAIEVAEATGKWIKDKGQNPAYDGIPLRREVTGEKKGSRSWNVLMIGLTASYPNLYDRIDRRVEERIQQGAINEVRKLSTMGYSRELPSMSGLGYRELRDEKFDQATLKWKFSEHRYARRQMTYFRNQFPNIVWFDITNSDYRSKTSMEVRKWYN